MEAAIKAIPLIDFEVTFGVEGSEGVHVGDILTIKLKITQVNLGEHEKSGFIHSNTFPYLKKSHWYLIMTDREEQEFYTFEKLHLKEKVFTKEIKDQMRKEGRMYFHFVLKNDSFKGFDKTHDIEVKIEKGVEIEMEAYHEEDLQAVKAPGLMQQMLDPT